VVFCDVVGSTALGERRDPELIRGVMARYFDAMRTVLERHGGIVEKFIGDAILAVVGIPRSMRMTPCERCGRPARCGARLTN
jgi:class 3 adenylate cyclase